MGRVLAFRAKGGSKLTGHDTPFPNRWVAAVGDVGGGEVTFPYKEKTARIGARQYRQSERAREGIARVFSLQERTGPSPGRPAAMAPSTRIACSGFKTRVTAREQAYTGRFHCSQKSGMKFQTGYAQMTTWWALSPREILGPYRAKGGSKLTYVWGHLSLVYLADLFAGSSRGTEIIQGRRLGWVHAGNVLPISHQFRGLGQVLCFVQNGDRNKPHSLLPWQVGTCLPFATNTGQGPDFRAIEHATPKTL